MELILFWFICAVVTAIIAASKDRSSVGWFFIGCLIGIFGLILVIVLPRKTPGTDNGREKRCPDCAEAIQYDARVCKHCGYRYP